MATPLPAHRDLSHGMRYQRILQLGSGGMANVYLSLAVGQSGFKRLVVVKSIRDELLANPDMRQMFLAEARLSARLNHPNVVQVSEVVDSSEGVMLVMEYLDGLSFAASYRALGDSLTLPMRLRIICEVLAGLQYAHELGDYHGKPLGIVHRDVSPQNVFVTYDGRVKLLDFGIAKASEAPDLTRAGMVKGRIAYMSLEQLKGDKVDRRADIYAVGCLLWEAVAGSRMWDKVRDPEIVRSVFAGKIPTLQSRVNAEPELVRIVSRATAQQASQRYSTADEMRLELERYMNSTLPMTLREIGDLLGDACQAGRAQRKQLIAEAIARVERDFPSLNDAVPEAESVSSWSTGTDTGSTPGSPRQHRPARSGVQPVGYPHPSEPGDSRAAADSDAASHARSRRNAAWIPIGGVILAALVGSLAHTRTVFDGAALEAQQGQLAPKLEPFLTVDSNPEGARVIVDGVPLFGEPATTRVSRGSEHVIRVELPGYTPVERRVLVEVDTSLNITLEREPEPEPPASAKSSAARARSRIPAAPVARPAPAPAESSKKETAKKETCNPPYYFSSGIKTYKPECI